MRKLTGFLTKAQTTVSESFHFFPLGGKHDVSKGMVGLCQSPTLTNLKTVMTQFVRLMDSPPPEQRKALLHLLIRRITVDKGKIAEMELHIDKTIQQSFLREGPSVSP